MSMDVASCSMDDSMNRVAQLMWERDCGCVPIVDELSRVIGIITDRDVCMAAYTQGRSLAELPVSLACSRDVQTCRGSDSLARAEALMTRAQVRRLPVVDDAGVLVGLLSLGDLAHRLKNVGAARSDTLGLRHVAAVLEAVTRPRRVPESPSAEPIAARRAPRTLHGAT
ncbi:MAG: CBS domain-containing protein [Polyangiales bacterium]